MVIVMSLLIAWLLRVMSLVVSVGVRGSTTGGLESGAVGLVKASNSCVNFRSVGYLRNRSWKACRDFGSERSIPFWSILLRLVVVLWDIESMDVVPALVVMSLRSVTLSRLLVLGVAMFTVNIGIGCRRCGLGGFVVQLVEALPFCLHLRGVRDESVRKGRAYGDESKKDLKEESDYENFFEQHFFQNDPKVNNIIHNFQKLK